MVSVGKRGLIGRQPTGMKEPLVLYGNTVVPRRAQKSGIVNPDFIPACENNIHPPPNKSDL